MVVIVVLVIMNKDIRGEETMQVKIFFSLEINEGIFQTRRSPH